MLTTCESQGHINMHSPCRPTSFSIDAHLVLPGTYTTTKYVLILRWLNDARCTSLKLSSSTDCTHDDGYPAKGWVSCVRGACNRACMDGVMGPLTPELPSVSAAAAHRPTNSKT